MILFWDQIINPKKLLVLIISPQENVPTPKLNIHLGSSALTIQDSVKYLDILIDRNLIFFGAYSFLWSKNFQICWHFDDIKNGPPKKALVSLYHALVHPHWLYDTVVWGAPFKT